MMAKRSWVIIALSTVLMVLSAGSAWYLMARLKILDSQEKTPIEAQFGLPKHLVVRNYGKEIVVTYPEVNSKGSFEVLEVPDEGLLFAFSYDGEMAYVMHWGKIVWERLGE